MKIYVYRGSSLSNSLTKKLTDCIHRKMDNSGRTLMATSSGQVTLRKSSGAAYSGQVIELTEARKRFSIDLPKGGKLIISTVKDDDMHVHGVLVRRSSTGAIQNRAYITNRGLPFGPQNWK